MLKKSWFAIYFRDVAPRTLIFTLFLILILNPFSYSNDDEPTPCWEKGIYSTGGRAKGIVLSGYYAYVACDDEGLIIVDVRNPANPLYAGRYDTEGRAYSVAVSGDYAYIADYDNGLVVVDVRNPADPLYAGKCNTNSSAYDVVVKGDYAYVADDGKGLVVVDVKNPTDPMYAGKYDIKSRAYSVDVSGGYVYMANGNKGLTIIDVSDPTDPQYAGEYDTSGEVLGVAVNGNYAYVANDYIGLIVLNVSDPTEPLNEGLYKKGNMVVNVDVSGDYAYVANNNNGLVIFDVSDPSYLQYLGGYYTDYVWYTWDVVVQGDYVFLADNLYGLVIVKLNDYDWDGVENQKDAFPYETDEWKDSDGDGLGDNSDDFPLILFLQTYTITFFEIIWFACVISVLSLINHYRIKSTSKQLVLLDSKQKWFALKKIDIDDFFHIKANSHFKRGHYWKSKFYSKTGLAKLTILENEYRTLQKDIEAMKLKVDTCTNSLYVSEILEKALEPSINSFEEGNLRSAREHLNTCEKMLNDKETITNPSSDNNQG